VWLVAGWWPCTVCVCELLCMDQQNPCTPLMIAAGEGHVDVVRALVSGGANLEAAAVGGPYPPHCSSLALVLDIRTHNR
jgi:hypothetical protein